MKIGQYVGSDSRWLGKYAEVQFVNGRIAARFLYEDTWHDFAMSEFARMQDPEVLNMRPDSELSKEELLQRLAAARQALAACNIFYRTQIQRFERIVECHAQGPLIVLYYPPGMSILANGQAVENVEVARALIAAIQAQSEGKTTGLVLPRRVELDRSHADVWRLFAEPTHWEIEVLRPKHNESGTEVP